jgi:multiple sugar transport system substrate-binding protein
MRKLTNIIMIVLMGIMLLSCKHDKKEISIIGESSASLNSINEIKDEYAELSGYKIITNGFTFEEALEKANVDFANGSGKYDIVMQYNFSLSSFVRNNYVYSLSELSGQEPDSAIIELEQDLFQNAWEEVGFYYKNPSKPDANYIKVGYPFAANTMILTYNKVMFENPTNQSEFKNKYGYDLLPPVTWSQLRDIAEFFTNKEKGTYGICMEGAAGGWLYYEWAMFAKSMGGGVMDKDHGWEGDVNTPLILTNEKTIAATEFYISLKPFNKGSYFNVDANEQIKEILVGDVAMAFVWSDYLYSAFFNNETKKFDNRFGFVKIPGEKSPLAGGAYFINKKSANPQEAYNFVQWLLNKENQIKMVKSGLSSPRRSVYDDPRVQDIPYIRALKESLETGVYMFEAGPDADLINGKITLWIQKAWKAEVSVKQALENAEKEIKKDRETIFKSL